MEIVKLGKGISISLLLGASAIILEKFTPSGFNSILIALLLGMTVGNLVKLPADWAPGIDYTGSKMLEFSLLFLAVGINYSEISKLGVDSFIGLGGIVWLVITLTFFLSKYFHCPTNTGILVGFGTAICGSSAIAALAPSLKNKEKEEVAISMAVVNLLGTMGMLMLPWLLIKLGYSKADLGYVIGATLHSVGNVAGAGFTLGKEAGDAAITVKLARITLLTPGLIYMNYLVNRGAHTNMFSLIKMPWYLVGFLVVSMVVSVFDLPTELSKSIEFIGKVVLTIAMSAIGMNVSFAKLMKAGSRGFWFGVVIFLMQIGLVLLFLSF